MHQIVLATHFACFIISFLFLYSQKYIKMMMWQGSVLYILYTINIECMFYGIIFWLNRYIFKFNLTFVILNIVVLILFKIIYFLNELTNY